MMATSVNIYVNIIAVLVGALWLWANAAVAKADEPAGSGWSLSVAVGTGEISNPVKGKDDLALWVLRHVRYEGERFFLQNLDMGFTLIENETQQLNALLTPSYDQIFFRDRDRWSYLIEAGAFSGQVKHTLHTEASNQMVVESNALEIQSGREPKRAMAALGGLEYQATLGVLDLQAQWLYDLTDYYQGQELRLSMSYEKNLANHTLSATFGARWLDNRSMNYFYGTAPNESPYYGGYQAPATWLPLARVDWRYPITPRFSLMAFASYRPLPQAVTESPRIVEDQVVTFFAGGIYHF